MQSQATPTEPKMISPFGKLSKNSWYITLILCLGVMAGTLVLWVYTSFVQEITLGSLRSEIQNVEQSIQDIAKDKNILIANIIKDSTKIRPSINVRDRVKNFYDIAAEAGVRFQGFTINQDKISTTLTATADIVDTRDPVATVIQMMRTHEKNVKILSLEPISSISGDPKKRSTTIELEVTNIQ